ncbi:MAG: tetratricopeptide repeat protein [Verrucomicrobiota bacterium]|nr:tetratricopeptide repeat protein [Limisphaera sp.]MDW8382522.1 tetratricopeptide repeat protein [Verrucomicrobiota bacterium]
MKSSRKKPAAKSLTVEARSTGACVHKTHGPVLEGRLWLYRFAAVVLIPGVLLGMAEMTLRLVGAGYPTTFLVPLREGSRELWVQNDRFGWRFFGPERSRVPHPFAIPQRKDTNAVRIFVFGESAAYGDPHPAFGLPRMLEAILELRHPGLRFEVINAAMTGLNSHGVLAIAEDCARAEGDVWVVYMGNNEVVGPFGAGTVFGGQVPPLPLIRAVLALKTMRLGQCGELALARLSQPAANEAEWGGMAMFLNHPVRLEDPRMKRVYHHFQRNLASLLGVARQHGVRVVVSTVAVNLRDCAPFGSAHRLGLSAADRLVWSNFWEQGIAAQAAGAHERALEAFARAAQVDETFAELRYRQGRSALALGAQAEAVAHFQAARDYDTLRFRCDGRLNGLIRETVAGWDASMVRLVDGEAVLARLSSAGVPGREFFYDHVHLTFGGHYWLSRAIAEAVEELLRGGNTAFGGLDRPWPTLSDCARRLAWTDWARHSALLDMVARLSDPPFPAQMNHAEQMEQLRAELEAVQSRVEGPGLMESLRLVEVAQAEAPHDPWLHLQRARLLQARGELDEAGRAAARVVELVPGAAEAWSLLGLIQAQRRQFESALEAFDRVARQNPQHVWALHNKALALARLGRTNEAIRNFERLLAFKPHFGPGWLSLGMLLEASGRAEAARPCFEKALKNRIRRPGDLALLARFCKARGWWEAAVTNYLDALALHPADAQLHMEVGQCWVQLNRRADAVRHFAEAVRLAPGSVQARFLYGLELARSGEAAAAERQFREAVRIMPDLLEARLNLALTLMDQGRLTEALAELDAVLARDPQNASARSWRDSIRERLAKNLDPPGSATEP